MRASSWRARRQGHYLIGGRLIRGRPGGPARPPGHRDQFQQPVAHPDDLALRIRRTRHRPVPARIVRPLHLGQLRLALPPARPDQHRHQPDPVRQQRRQLLLHDEPRRQVARGDQQQRGPGPPHPVIDVPPPIITDRDLRVVPQLQAVVAHVRFQHHRELAPPVLIVMAIAEEDSVPGGRPGRPVHHGNRRLAPVRPILKPGHRHPDPRPAGPAAGSPWTSSSSVTATILTANPPAKHKKRQTPARGELPAGRRAAELTGRRDNGPLSLPPATAFVALARRRHIHPIVAALHRSSGECFHHSTARPFVCGSNGMSAD